jgi:glycosyltransferase involved in cell wall biosynthesis
MTAEDGGAVTPTGSQTMPDRSSPPLSATSGPRPDVSVVIPCYNEASALGGALEGVMDSVPDGEVWEVLVVDDGSTDGTGQVLSDAAARHTRLRVISHDVNRGYGAALKTGFARARGDFLATLDADGTYPAAMLPVLVERARVENLTMVVGARRGTGGHSPFRAIPKSVFRMFVTWLVDRPVPDFNSGLRVVDRRRVMGLLQLLPDGFSLTTTLTIALMRREPDLVGFEEIEYRSRVGKSKIRPVRDTLQFMQLILRTGVFFAPMRAFLPLIVLLTIAFVASAGYDVFVLDNLTDKTVIFLMFTLNTGMFALLADMIEKSGRL